MYTLLCRMERDEYIAKLERPHASLDYHWTLRTTGKPLPKPLSLAGYEHAVMVANIYVSFALTGDLLKWQSTPVRHRSLEEDAKATFRFSPAICYFEIDRATEHEGVIRSKADRYLKRTELWYAIFVAPSTNRAEAILDELPRLPDDRFLVCLHDDIHRDPRAQIFVSATRPTEYQHLSDVIPSIRTDTLLPDTSLP